MPVTDFPHVMTITKRLADGTLAEYRYHRRSRVRIFAEWGSPEFAEDYRLAASGHKTAAGRHQIRQRSQDRPRPTFVYFILATVSGMIKIGRADDPKRRFCVLQTGSAEVLELLGTVPDTNYSAATSLVVALLWE